MTTDPLTPPCQFGPRHEPFYCRIHGDVRLALTDERCRTGFRAALDAARSTATPGLREAAEAVLASGVGHIGQVEPFDRLRAALAGSDPAAMTDLSRLEAGLREARRAVADLPEWTGHPAAGVQRVAVDNILADLAARSTAIAREYAALTTPESPEREP